MMKQRRNRGNYNNKVKFNLPAGFLAKPTKASASNEYEYCSAFS